VAPVIVPSLPKMQQQAPGATRAPTSGDVRFPWKSYTHRALRSLGSNDNLVDDVVAPSISQRGFAIDQFPAQRGYGT
jgi:hypothetical protein